MHRKPFTLAAVLVTGLLVSGVGAAVVSRTDGVETVTIDDPGMRAADVAKLRPVARPTPASVATPAPPPTTAAPAAVDVPDDPYAPEPVVEIGTIEIPKIGLRHRMFHGITLRNIDRGPSHWPGTPMPGENGNVVIAGHRVTHSRPFRNIDKLVPGDEIFFEVQGVRTRYLVTGHEVVTPKDTWIVNPTPTPTATLFACHPPGSARYRYVVRAALAAD